MHRDRMIQLCHGAVYNHLRLAWQRSPEDAEALAQRFFAEDAIDGGGPREGPLRERLRDAVDRFAGGARPERGDFDREWARSLFSAGVEALRERLVDVGLGRHFLVFARHDLAEQRPSYADLADELELSAAEVDHGLAIARRELRAILWSTLRELCESDAELEAEARTLLGEAP